MKAVISRHALRKPSKSSQAATHAPHAIPILIDMFTFGDTKDRQFAATTLDQIERCCSECRSLLARSRLR